MWRETMVWTARGIGIALGVGIVIGLSMLAQRAVNVLILVFLSLLLASALEPFIGWLRGHVPLGRGTTILVVYVAFVVFVAWLVFLILPAAVTQLEDLVASLPPLLEGARTWASGLQPAALQTGAVAIIDAIGKQFGPAPPPDPDVVVEAGLTVAEFVVSLTTILALVVLWLVVHARLPRYALALVPAGRRAGWREAWNEIETRLGLWVRGQLFLTLAIGVATGIAYWLLGVPSALLLAIFAGFAEAIPLVGPALGAVPAILVALTVSPELAITVGVVYVILQFVEGMLLVPMVMKNTIGLSASRPGTSRLPRSRARLRLTPPRRHFPACGAGAVRPGRSQGETIRWIPSPAMSATYSSPSSPSPKAATWRLLSRITDTGGDAPASGSITRKVPVQESAKRYQPCSAGAAPR